MRKLTVILLALCILLCIVPVMAEEQEQDFSVTSETALPGTKFEHKVIYLK